MTPRDARRAGASWATSLARARHDGPYYPTVVAYRLRWQDEHDALAGRELREAFVAGYREVYDAEWARLEGEAEA